MPRRSLPVRERGLKFDYDHTVTLFTFVAPRAGAWIEISVGRVLHLYPTVAPRAGAWIEIQATRSIPWTGPSLPVRERGLKYYNCQWGRNDRKSLPVRERGLKSRMG